MILVLLTLVLLGGQCTQCSLLNLASLPLSQKCSLQIKEFIGNLSMDANSWALQMLDASSKLSSGLLSLNFGDMGDFQQCIKIDVSTTTTEDIHGQYCLGYLSLDIIDKTIPWALCLPDGCSTNDADLIGNTILQKVPLQKIRVTFSDLLCQTREDANPKLTTAAVVTIGVLTTLVLVVLVATLWDTYNTFYEETISCPLIFKSFSVYTNAQEIFKMSTPTKDHLPCLDGLKFISMMWVVACHQFTIPPNGSIVNTKYLTEWGDSLYSMLFVNGNLAVDTFFTIGGTLMAFAFMKARSTNKPFNCFLYYTHRYIRLTPPFAIVVLVSATLLKYISSGPKWPLLVLYFQNNCQDYWWSALLYVQNYVNVSEMCVGQSWYLDVDMQLYIFSPFVLYALWKYPKWCLIFVGLSSLASISLSFYLAWSYQLPAILSNPYSTHINDYLNGYYLLTHTRLTPWIFGIIVGYLIYKIKQTEHQLELSTFLVWIIWGVSLTTLLVCVFGGHSTLRSPEYDQWGNALHIALVRPVWSLAIAWIILACITNKGGPINWILSLPIYQVLNRFTYSIYLTHVTLLYVVAYGREQPDYFSNFNMAYQFWGTLCFSTGLAILLVFTTEAPVVAIERLLLAGNVVKKTKKRRRDFEKGIHYQTLRH